MDYSTPGSSVFHCLPQFAQIHVNCHACPLSVSLLELDRTPVTGWRHELAPWGWPQGWAPGARLHPVLVNQADPPKPHSQGRVGGNRPGPRSFSSVFLFMF